MARRIAGEVPGFHPWFVGEEGGRLLGYAASSPFRTRPAYRWTVETGIYPVPRSQGQRRRSGVVDRIAPDA
jgi:phosphinothricin acetyltransferase